MPAFRPSARARFDETIRELSERTDRISDVVFASLALAALADLAADLQDPSLEHTRDILMMAAIRVERLAARRSSVRAPILEWHRMVNLAPDETAIGLRSRAIRDAEARLRENLSRNGITAPLSGYRSNSISQ